MLKTGDHSYHFLHLLGDEIPHQLKNIKQTSAAKRDEKLKPYSFYIPCSFMYVVVHQVHPSVYTNSSQQSNYNHDYMLPSNLQITFV
jgi:hypothetical protein